MASSIFFLYFSKCRRNIVVFSAKCNFWRENKNYLSHALTMAFSSGLELSICAHPDSGSCSPPPGEAPPAPADPPPTDAGVPGNRKIPVLRVFNI